MAITESAGFPAIATLGGMLCLVVFYGLWAAARGRHERTALLRKAARVTDDAVMDAFRRVEQSVVQPDGSVLVWEFSAAEVFAVEFATWSSPPEWLVWGRTQNGRFFRVTIGLNEDGVGVCAKEVLPQAKAAIAAVILRLKGRASLPADLEVIQA